jgi:hypothetical protein
MPSPSRSNPCGSGGTTLKSLSAISSQFKSGGGDAIQTSGYEASQSELDEAFSFVRSRRALGESDCRNFEIL